MARWLKYEPFVLVLFRPNHIKVHLGLDFLRFDQHMDSLVFEQHVGPPVVDQRALGFLMFEQWCLSQLIKGRSYEHLN